MDRHTHTHHGKKPGDSLFVPLQGSTETILSIQKLVHRQAVESP